MISNNLDNLSELQKDALKELGTIGAGHAASALSELLNRSIYMKVPSVRIIKVKSIPDALRSRFSSDVNLAISSASNTTELYYTVLVLFNKETVNEIIDQKAPPSYDIEAVMEFSTISMSLIKEFGSIILLKIVTTLNQFLNVSGALPSIPQLRIGNLDSLLQNELEMFNPESKVIFIKGDIYSEDETEIRADCILLPHVETFDRFFGSLFTQYI
ncbi:MAG: chemotaxis protein CheC [Candidatus Hodarchaeales archaeon]|jgi:chemotaxis protein CheC